MNCHLTQLSLSLSCMYRKYLDQELQRRKRRKDRGKMKSSATNVQVDVTFYKKTFNSRFSLAEWVSDAVAAKESSLQKKRYELKCVAMWHYYWQYYYHHQLNSQCAFRIVSLRLLALFLSLSRFMYLMQAGEENLLFMEHTNVVINFSFEMHYMW